MTEAGTISRIAPALGMTAKAMRSTLIASGMLDTQTGEPTAEAFMLGCVFMVEKPSRNGYYRAAVWRRDPIIAAMPALDPDRESVLRSFRHRHAAAAALFEGISEIRDHVDQRRAELLAPLCDDEIRATVVEMQDRIRRASYVQKAVMPSWRSFDRTGLTPEAMEIAERIDGALSWFVDIARAGPKDIGRITVTPDAEPDRDLRLYGDSMSIVTTHHEREMLINGRCLSAADEDPVTARLARSILGTLAVMLQPDADEATQLAAAGMPARCAGVGARRVLLTVRPGIEPGSLAASAHRLSVNLDRVSVKASPSAFAYLADANGEPLDSDGPDIVVQGLIHLARNTAAAGTAIKKEEEA